VQPGGDALPTVARVAPEQVPGAAPQVLPAAQAGGASVLPAGDLRHGPVHHGATTSGAGAARWISARCSRPDDDGNGGGGADGAAAAGDVRSAPARLRHRSVRNGRWCLPGQLRHLSVRNGEWCVPAKLRLFSVRHGCWWYVPDELQHFSLRHGRRWCPFLN
jgi:hypothetical protein